MISSSDRSSNWQDGIIMTSEPMSPLDLDIVIHDEFESYELPVLKWDGDMLPPGSLLARQKTLICSL